MRIVKSAAGPRYPPPVILPAAREDIPKLARIQASAVLPDLMTIARRTTREELESRMISALSSNFDDPHVSMMKAVDADTGEITAMAVWSTRGYVLTEKGGDGSVRQGNARSFLFPKSLPATAAVGESSQDDLDAIGKYIQEKFNEFVDSWIMPTKCFVLELLMTDPRFQRRGIGTALLAWGHKRADRDQVNLFLVATPIGHGLYRAVGWKEVSVPVRIDLQDWLAAAKSGDMGWGTYQYYFMMRLPLLP